MHTPIAYNFAWEHLFGDKGIRLSKQFDLMISIIVDYQASDALCILLF